MHGDHGESPQPLTHRMWYLQKCVELVGTHQLRQASLDYAWRLHEAVYHDLPDGRDIWEFMTECRTPFLAAARQELDIPEVAKPQPHK
jgi:hypothetical protein